MIEGINHVNVVVNELEKSEAFFGIFGYKKEKEGLLQGEWISNALGLENISAKYIALGLPNNSAKIELIQFFTPESYINKYNSSANCVGYRHIALQTSNIKEEIKKLNSLGIQFTHAQYKEDNKEMLYLIGPDNIIIEIAQYLGA